MMDPPRIESAAVAECIEAGIRPVMITGDHKVTASAIAKRIGILREESEACEGAVIDGMSDEELKDFGRGISVYARVSPEHKIRIVRAWQDKGQRGRYDGGRRQRCSGAETGGYRRCYGNHGEAKCRRTQLLWC